MAGHTRWSKVREGISSDQQERIAERLKAVKIGILIAELREAAGMTQQQIADKLGITQPGVSQMEAGDEIQLTTLRKLVSALGGEIVLHMPNREISLTQVMGEANSVVAD